MNRSNIDTCIESKDSVALFEAFSHLTPDNIKEYAEMVKYTLETLRTRSETDEDYEEMLFIFSNDLPDIASDYFTEYADDDASAKKAFKDNLFPLLDKETQEMFE